MPFTWHAHGGGAVAPGLPSDDEPQLSWSICADCYEKRARCAACGLVVGRQAFMLEGDLHFYCTRCFHERPRCDTCDRPVGPHYWTRPDGRKLCDRCQSTAVTDPNQVHTYWRSVRATIARELGMALREPCQLKLVSRDQLLSMIERSSLHVLDADGRGRCFGIFVQDGMSKAILIEHGLPRIVLLEVMAHEFAHAWQSEQRAFGPSLEIQEGFAEWVAFKLLHSWGCRRRSDRMLRRDDVYGRGLQMMLRWESEGSKAEVFRRIRTGGSLST